MIDQMTIDKAVRTLLSASPAGSEVILFGSYARGDAREGSDLDFLVVEPRPVARMREAARLDRALSTIRVPADVLVVSRKDFEEWKDTPNTVIYEAAREGKAFSEVA
jgi:predicted nucleotidyltransferase